MKTEILRIVADIQERLETLRTIVHENTKGERNLNGLLTKDRDMYLKCLELGNIELENLLR